MSILSTLQIAGIAIKAIDKVIDKFPNYDQKQIEKWKYLKDMYELERKKPRYQEGEDNHNARSEDRLLNLRDQCLLYGETLVKQAGQRKG